MHYAYLKFWSISTSLSSLSRTNFIIGSWGSFLNATGCLFTTVSEGLDLAVLTGFDDTFKPWQQHRHQHPQRSNFDASCLECFISTPIISTVLAMFSSCSPCLTSLVTVLMPNCLVSIAVFKMFLVAATLLSVVTSISCSIAASSRCVCTCIYGCVWCAHNYVDL